MIRTAIIFLAMLIGIPWIVCRFSWGNAAGHQILDPKWVPLAVMVIVGALARFRTVNEPASKIFDRVRHLSPSQMRRATLLIWILSVAYLTFTAFHQHRDLFPRIHDEHSYLIQSRMLAAGKLWEPSHPLADFFDNFYMLSRPVYAPIYFPGTALLDAPFVRLGLPYWSMPVLAGGLVVALTFHLVSLLVDSVCGLLAAAFVISNWGLREYSTMVMAQVPTTLLVLLILLVWLAWRKNHRIGWALLLGVFMGWAAITRPVDALAFSAPVLAVMAFDLKRSKRQLLLTAFAVIIGTVPLFLLQAALNRGTTGSAFKTPYAAYLHQDQPGSEFGFHPFHADARPASVLPQKKDYFERYRMLEIRNHTLARLPGELMSRAGWTVICTMPAGILAIFLLPGLWGLTNRVRWAVWASVPLFICLYALNPFFLVHYPIPLIPVMAFTVALGVQVLARDRQTLKPDPHSTTFLALIVLAVCTSSLPELRRDIRDGTKPEMPLTAMLHNQLAAAVEGPAVVLIRFQTGDNSVEDPVYNDDVVWPDDASIIRAHDLGPRNIEIARYYASRRPSRKFYLLDRRENTGQSKLILHALGTAGEFLHACEQAPIDQLRGELH